jgi:simple sugar transport system permease protein
MRFIGVVLSGCLGGLGGAYLSIGYTSQFGKLMTNGRGFIALAALIFGNWTPIGCLIAGLFFGFLTGLNLFIQILTGIDPSFAWLQDYSYFVQMIPYVLVIVALAGIRRSVPPKAVGTAYEKEAAA